MYVVAAWKKALFAAFGQSAGAVSPPGGTSASPIAFHFLADDTGKFTSDLGQTWDAEKLLGNRRSKRYALFLIDGVVHDFIVDTDPTLVEKTSADYVLHTIMQPRPGDGDTTSDITGGFANSAASSSPHLSPSSPVIATQASPAAPEGAVSGARSASSQQGDTTAAAQTAAPGT